MLRHHLGASTVRRVVEAACVLFESHTRCCLSAREARATTDAHAGGGKLRHRPPRRRRIEVVVRLANCAIHGADRADFAVALGVPMCLVVLPRVDLGDVGDAAADGGGVRIDMVRADAVLDDVHSNLHAHVFAQRPDDQPVGLSI